MCDVVLLDLPKSRYLSDLILEELQDLGVDVKRLNVERKLFPNKERYYRLLIDSNFSLLGKTAVFIGSLTSDEDILDMYRIGSALAQAGLKRRVFIIPYLAYQSMDRANFPGEVVTAKCTNQMLGIVGSSNEGNVFVFLDLHYACLLHYFEGSCLRIELYAQNALLSIVQSLYPDLSNIMIGSTNVRRAAWVNSYAQALHCPIAFIREKFRSSDVDDIAFKSEPEEVLGDVKGRHVIIYDDIIRSGRTIINAAMKYLEAGATSVDVMASHLCFFEDNQIEGILRSPIKHIIGTNSHPVTQNYLIQQSSRFCIVDISDVISQCLFEVLPTPDHMHRSSI